MVEQNAQSLREDRNNQVYSLNLNKFKEDLKKDKEAKKKNELVKNYKSHLKFDYPTDDQASWQSDSVKVSKASRWKGQLEKDIYLEEAVNVMQDILK